MKSAFGIDHGDFSKAGPVGAGLSRLGRAAGKKNSGSTSFGSGLEQKATRLASGQGTDLQRTKVGMTTTMRGKRAKVLGGSKNFRSGYQRAVGESRAAGQHQGRGQLPSFLR